MTGPEPSAKLPLRAIIDDATMAALGSARTPTEHEHNLDLVVTFAFGGARYQKR